MKQYNPKKPIKKGYKLWCVADDDRYLYKFENYYGKATSTIEEIKDIGMGGNVVYRMSMDFHGHKHKLFFAHTSIRTVAVKTNSSLWHH